MSKNLGFITLVMATALYGCSRTGKVSSGSAANAGVAIADSCMECHNGAGHNDYSGPGLENPHPFPGAGTLKCTDCHGGNGSQYGNTLMSHVPPPPQIGDENHLLINAQAYFNRLTLAGIDKYANYTVNGVIYTWLDYLEFINPGDIRVVTNARGCGKCHAPHSESVSRMPLATEMGILSSSMFTLGLPNNIPQNQGLFEDTASDYGFRAVTNPNFVLDPAHIGAVGSFLEFPVHSKFGDNTGIFNNPIYDSGNLPNSIDPATGKVLPNSPLAHLFQEQVAFTCGDCHLGSAGANNRYGDYRSSGCTACHMRYSESGQSNLSDINIRKNEPIDPDDIDAPERAHVKRHMIKSIARTIGTGEVVEGIDDYACVDCHQGSNRTVLQYWGIRLDQNADLAHHVQYPANPASFRSTHADTRLFDPVVNNRTFNGRNPNQYIWEEDYDGDTRDDTPADVHYEAGLGCIDCHGSHDIHGGKVGDPNKTDIYSRQEQAVAIRCESCHGSIENYAATQPCVTYDGVAADCALDAEGNPLKHVTKDAGGNYILKSRLTGRTHFIKQTRDVIANNGKLHPATGQPVYNAMASYAMGRIDNDATNGIGPKQTDGSMAGAGFSHTDSMSCVACHASWANNCIGCHLGGEYNTGNNFSNITGDRIVYKQANADFTYQTPVPFQLGVSTRDEISVLSPNTLVFYNWLDRNDDLSQTFYFADRHGYGSVGANQHPALSHNIMMPHSIRGKVASRKEGPRYCVACHLTTDALANFGGQYDSFRTIMAANDYQSFVDQGFFPLLKQHIGQNTGNQLNSPFWVHMVAGLGSGLFWFDLDGCPTNPLDDNANRVGCNGTSPQTKFNVGNIVLNLDRVVEGSGETNSSNNHMMLHGGASAKRDGAANPKLAGPMGQSLIQALTDPLNGIILDSWIDANGQLRGDAGNFVP